MQRQADSRFEEIYERHHEDVTLYVRRRVAADAVEDLVAETFLVCWRKLDDVPRESASTRLRRRQSGYSSFRQARTSAGWAFGVRSSRELKYGVTNGSGAMTV